MGLGTIVLIGVVAVVGFYFIANKINKTNFHVTDSILAVGGANLAGQMAPNLKSKYAYYY